MLNILVNNPFRVLGVCSSATQKDIVRNISKLKAYLNIGKEFSFQYDLGGVLPPMERNLNSIQTAQNQLNLEIDRATSGLFWFVIGSSVDQIAIDNYSAGNTSKAIDQLSKKENFSSLLNLSVIYLIERKIELALISVSKVLASEAMVRDYLNTVCSETTYIEASSLRTIYIDNLIEDVDAVELYSNLKNNYVTQCPLEIAYLKEKIKIQCIAKINSLISGSQLDSECDAEAYYDAGKKLIDASGYYLDELKYLLSDTIEVYQHIADKLAKVILQLGINYFNYSEEHKRTRIKKAKELQRYALKIAEGKLAKERCRHNVDILIQQERLLPLEIIEGEINAIQRELLLLQSIHTSNIANLKHCLEKFVPLIVSIMGKLGANHEQVITHSTDIAALFLSKMIDIVNEAMEKASSGNAVSYYSLKCTITRAWELTMDIDSFPMSKEFKENRFDPNKQSLKELVKQIASPSVFKYKSKIDLRTEEERFRACATIAEYEKYILDFPGGRYTQKAREEIRKIKALDDDLAFDLAQTIEQYESYLANKEYTRHRDAAELKIEKLKDEMDFRQCSSIDDYVAYVAKHPNGAFVNDAKEAETALRKYARKKKIIVLLIFFMCAGIILNLFLTEDDRKFSHVIKEQSGYEEYLRAYPNGKHADESYSALYDIYKENGLTGLDQFAMKFPSNKYSDMAELILNNIADSMYTVACRENTLRTWVTYRETLPEKYWKDVPLKITLICDALYTKANQTNSLNSWKNYIKTVPVYELRDAVQKYYDKTLKINTIAAWNSYKSHVPVSEYKDADDRIKEIEEVQKWKTESTAWAASSNVNTIEMYEKYLKFHPNGQHSAAAKKRIIDLKVTNMSFGTHDQLPSMDHDYWTSGSTSKVTITNDTGYTMTALYSGISQSKELIIPPHGIRSVSLLNGQYRIAVSVDVSNVHGYYGCETLTGGNYSASYYIVTARY